MFLDKQLLVSDGQSLAQTAATYVSTNSIDLGTAGIMPLELITASGVAATTTAPIYDIGRGIPVELLVQITTTVTSGGSATIVFNLITSANSDLSSATVLQSTPALGYATLVAGYQVRLGGQVPPGIGQRYLGISFTVATATTTAGTMTAGLLVDKQTAGYNV